LISYRQTSVENFLNLFQLNGEPISKHRLIEQFKQKVRPHKVAASTSTNAENVEKKNDVNIFLNFYHFIAENNRLLLPILQSIFKVLIFNKAAITLFHLFDHVVKPST
jgi:nitrate/nitrite-specific signal transduction histidine kinase